MVKRVRNKNYPTDLDEWETGQVVDVITDRLHKLNNARPMSGEAGEAAVAERNKEAHNLRNMLRTIGGPEGKG
jgi:hypothetical protein